MQKKSKIDLTELQQLSLDQLLALFKKYRIKEPQNINRQELIFTIVNYFLKKNPELELIAHGALEIIDTGFGFLRGKNSAYLPGDDDIYIAPNQIKLFKLRTGDQLTGIVRLPKDHERCYGLLKILKVNNEKPEKAISRANFEDLVPIYPDSQLVLENSKNENNVTSRIIDLFTPIGKGQRGLIVAPPKAGKTELLKQIALSIRVNDPQTKLIILLIDERPEEVTEFVKVISRANADNKNKPNNIDAEVIASTFDEPAERHVQVANGVIEQAKRLVEHRKDVVILLDSITRLTRAYNTEEKSSGKTLSGGIDANSLYKPKKFFGAARNIEGKNQGSLTIIATALIETGSRMDDVIFEEFKGTGNMELVLSRTIAEHRVFPAIDIIKSGTRRDDKLLDNSTYNFVYNLREELAFNYDETTTLKKIKELLNSSKTNQELVTRVTKS